MPWREIHKYWLNMLLFRLRESQPWTPHIQRCRCFGELIIYDVCMWEQRAESRERDNAPEDNWEHVWLVHTTFKFRTAAGNAHCTTHAANSLHLRQKCNAESKTAPPLHCHYHNLQGKITGASEIKPPPTVQIACQDFLPSEDQK